MLIRRLFCAAGASAALLAPWAALSQTPAPATAPAAPVPVEAFFQNAAFSGGTLSPNGRYLAIKVAPRGARTQLVVMDVEKLTAKALVSPTDVDIATVTWVNDDRLVFSVHDSETATGDTVVQRGLYAVSRDGSDYRQLVERSQPWLRERGDSKGLNFTTRLLAPTRERKSDDVFVVQWDYNSRYEYDTANVLRLNTVTGRASAFNRPGKTVRWVIDATDTPRVAVTVENGREAVWRLGEGGKWEQLADHPQFSGEGFTPVAMTRDGSLYVTSAPRGQDKQGLYRFDTSKKAIDPEPVFTMKDFDFNGRFVMGLDGPAGIRYTSDAAGTVWFDAKWKEVQAKVDSLLPNTVNQIEVPLRGEVPIVMVYASSDTDPGTYLLFNTQTSRFTVLGGAMRDIDARRMAQRDLVRYKARDGLEIPAWITIPKGGKGKKLPMVVLVHGGPWVRGGTWKWDADSQFLASRGYVVLEPEFRGSEGYGWRHFRAGFKQWGLAMQDDVADGARWAIAQGIADPQRICIAGASYGGYATLMGLANDPDLYKCGVEWVGVSDIELMYSVTWSDFSQAWKEYGMPKLVGDREKDAEQLKKTSPLLQAARIKQPLLMAYGGADSRVPIVHGVKMRDALKAGGNANVEWVEYTEEGHGWSLVKNRVDFWTRVEKFLDKNIGAGAH
jgi:dipeptidyl aminopeptidase/acylaminoacyl peptidase